MAGPIFVPASARATHNLVQIGLSEGREIFLAMPSDDGAIISAAVIQNEIDRARRPGL